MPNNISQPPSIGEFLRRYLQTQECRPSASKRQNGFNFTFEGVNFSFISFPDPNYFRIVLPISGVPLNTSHQDIINRINSEVRVVKAIHKGEDKLWLVAEQYVYSDNGIFLLFERLIRLLLYVYHAEEYSFRNRG